MRACRRVSAEPHGAHGRGGRLGLPLAGGARHRRGARGLRARRAEHGPPCGARSWSAPAAWRPTCPASASRPSRRRSTTPSPACRAGCASSWPSAAWTATRWWRTTGAPRRWRWPRPSRERVERLVLMDAVPLLPGYEWHTLARQWRRPLVGEMAMGFTFKFVTRRLLRLPDGSDFPAAELDDIWDHFDHGTQRAILRLYRSAPPRALEAAGAQLGRIALPGAGAVGRRRPLPARRASRTTTPPRWAARPRSRWWRAPATGPGSGDPRWSIGWPRSWAERRAPHYARGRERPVGQAAARLRRGHPGPGQGDALPDPAGLLITFGIVRAITHAIRNEA